MSNGHGGEGDDSAPSKEGHGGAEETTPPTMGPDPGDLGVVKSDDVGDDLAAMGPDAGTAEPGDVLSTLVEPWGRPPELRCRGGERCGRAAAGWLVDCLIER